MKVLVIHHNETLGGAERSICELAAGLVRRGVKVEALVPGEGRFKELLERAGAGVSVVEMPRLKRTLNPMKLASYLKARKELSEEARRRVKEGGFDIVHFNSLSAAVLFGEGLEELAPVVLHLRDSLVPRVVFSAYAKDFPAYVAISSYMERVLKEFLKAPPNRVFKVVNGITFPERVTPARRKAAREALGVPQDAFVVLAAAAFVPWKNQHSLMEAFKKARERMDSPLLVLCGSDLTGENATHAKKIRSMARSLKQSCLLAGQVDELEPWLHAADVFAHPAIGEPFGRAPAEAQAAGLPVVAYRSGAMEEVVEHGETGLVCDLDSAAFAEALAVLHDDVEMRRRMGEAAAERARKLFDAERTADEVLELYRGLKSGELPEPEPRPTVTQKELRDMRRRKRRRTR